MTVIDCRNFFVEWLERKVLNIFTFRCNKMKHLVKSSKNQAITMTLGVKKMNSSLG